MTEQIKDGGPAFPVIGAPGAPEDCPGMTLLDYFAAKAMQANLTGHISHYGHDNWPFDHMASHAYDIAAAMLKAREAA